MMSDFYQRYLLPGLVFQSVVIGGGYATGRELINFFAHAGPAGGLLGMGVTTVIWSVVLAISFELVRRTQSYDYKSFFTLLLGRGWFLFEIAYFLLLILVMSVLGAASGEIVNETLGAPKLTGTLVMMVVVAAIVFAGGPAVERALGWAGLVLFSVFIVLVIWSLTVFGDRIVENYAAVPVQGNWFKSGVTYSAYNMASVVATFFCIRHLTRRREAIIAGLLAGPLTMLPGMLFFVAMMGYYPEIKDAPLPSVFLAAKLNAPWFNYVFQIVVLWALIATGVGMIHAINERLASSFQERSREMPRLLRPVVALALLSLSVFVADAVGIIGLIAQGYGALTWAFIAVLVIPVLTVGIWKLRQLGAEY
jgi:uncharacterized membrane protein YkvI